MLWANPGFKFFYLLPILSTYFQPWVRYLEGDNISTKIGSGRVEIEIRMAIPTFWQIGIGEVNPSFPRSGKIEESQDKWREIGQNWGKSGKIEENRDKLGTIPTYLEHFKRLGWPSRPIPKCRDESGRLKNPDLDFGSRSGRPPQSSPPIAAYFYVHLIDCLRIPRILSLLYLKMHG